ncbi:substrate-binding domain-containing protein [Viridibacterium curvum]|uniref:Molybdate ABC transporter substrate-binding protein n=1 Tax=Viridibacterium curvum TaxID=1101404 RepID=A0ABP9R2N9_9RHOO
MATRLLLTDVTQAFSSRANFDVQITSMGGVDAVKKLQAGACFDIVVLARDAIDILAASGHVVAGSDEDWVHSSVAIAMREDAANVDVESEHSFREAVLAHRVGYSTGPSGTALLKLFERWGIQDQMRTQLTQAPAGVSVAHLVADGRVGIGIQQLSELKNVPGVRVLGLLPPGCEINSTFSTAIGATTTRQREVQEFIRFMHSADAAEIVNRHGMSPVKQHGVTKSGLS